MKAPQIYIAGLRETKVYLDASKKPGRGRQAARLRRRAAVQHAQHVARWSDSTYEAKRALRKQVRLRQEEERKQWRSEFSSATTASTSTIGTGNTPPLTCTMVYTHALTSTTNGTWPYGNNTPSTTSTWPWEPIVPVYEVVL